MTQYFIQMSGVPGSGKSTIAQKLGIHFNAVVLDHDDTKSALLASGLEDTDAGRGSYEVLKVLSEKILSQGHTVIFDSPCLYIELLQNGQNLSAQYNAEYRYIECRLSDETLWQNRLIQRNRKPSQVESLDGYLTRDGKQWPIREVFRQAAIDMKRPEQGYLVIDTSVPLEKCVEKAIRYIQCGT